MLEEFIKNYVEQDLELLKVEYDNEEQIHNIMYSDAMIVQACEKYLSQTDYVVIKMSESQMLGESIEELNFKYGDIIENRKQARKRIDELK